jgi:ABC-type lipoprotein release transport system permease subunit
MFELSIALKYLLPKWRQLSVSIISMISILVIALVVWLIVVFFSVTYGLEKTWIQKLIALTAPVRVVPTEAYYNSPYYLLDGISSSSNFTSKSIGQKLLAKDTNPYNPEHDEEIPRQWPKSDLNSEGKLKDIVKLAFASVQGVSNISGLKSRDYEMAAATLKLKLNKVRGKNNEDLFLTQGLYMSSYDPDNTTLTKAILPLTDKFTLKDKLPNQPLLGEGILLPKSFHSAGASIGDRGTLNYQIPTASAMQEQHIPVFVVGFYDPGILPIGGKVLIANQSLVSIVRSSYPSDESSMSNGINVRFNDMDDAEKVKIALVQSFKDNGIDQYWRVETFREFDLSKDILTQLRSEKNLFTIISAVIIIVACSNIISMLIILVNDKKTEIGILRSMGATSTSIATIFGLCGVVMGLLGSALGIGLAVVTLHYLDSLIKFISRMQGFDMFNAMMYGDTLPNEISYTVLTVVIIATALVSLLAGIVPAVKACLMRPSQILRSQ